MTDEPSDIRPAENRILASPPLRFALLVFGWLMFAIGIISVPVPLFPSTIFLLAAVWAFSLSSQRFRAWILKRPWLGTPLRAWQQYRALLRYGMAFAMATMVVSLAVVALDVTHSWMAAVAVAVILFPVAWYILRRPDSKNNT